MSAFEGLHVWTEDSVWRRATDEQIRDAGFVPAGELEAALEDIAEQQRELVAIETFLRKHALCTFGEESRAYEAALVELTRLRTEPGPPESEGK